MMFGTGVSHRLLAVAVAVLAALCPAAARAQSLDYTTLEQVFGEPITASVTGKPQRASDVPGDLTIITQDDIRRYNAPLGGRLLVLVDGRQIYADDNGRVAWHALPVQLAEIRQIEIVKGPNSALFGFNAAAGVINIITFDPLLDKVNSATIEGGTPSYGEVNAVGTAHLSDTAGVRLSAGAWEAREFGGETTLTGQPAPRYGSVNLDAHWQVTPNILLRASGGATDARASQDQVGDVFRTS
jgi:iron complex outermembrane receptor protein